MDARMQEATRAEWRELGFFYDCDDAAREWVIVGSRDGLRRFSELLREYVADPRNAVQSEHDHFGPYMYLEVMTWSEAGMDGHSIHGPLSKLHDLAGLVDERTAGLQPGARARIREEFASSSEYALVLHLREDGFDPSTLDGNLQTGAGQGGS
jgi:hypothetical protein